MRENTVRALARRRQRERRGATIDWTLGFGSTWVGFILKLSLTAD